MKNSRNIQIAVVAGVVLLAGFLYTREIKGLVKPEETATTESATGMPAAAGASAQLNLNEVSATAKNLISNASEKEITLLEQKHQNAKDAAKTDAALKLAKRWDDLGQPEPSALYWEEVAKAQSSLNNWLSAGDMFLKAYDNSQDSLVRPAALQKAYSAYQNAIKLDSTSLAAKTGLGVSMVNGMGAPMEGIKKLMDVVNLDPKNFKANLYLGMFAMKSGQFDKAISRFEKIVKEIKATPDVYFYLATSYEQMGQKQAAINAYLESKKLAANPTISSFVDKKVAELKQ